LRCREAASVEPLSGWSQERWLVVSQARRLGRLRELDAVTAHVAPV
jgi:hypothetical protein